MSLFPKISSLIKPSTGKSWLLAKVRNMMIRQAPQKHERALKKIRKKDSIKVAFFVQNLSKWKYDGVFLRMLKHDRFEPIIIVLPSKIYGKEFLEKDIKQAYKYFSEIGYPTVLAYDINAGKCLNVKKVINPDIIFFSSPYWEYNIDHTIFKYADTLTCYAPYNFGNSHLMNIFYGLPFHSLLWRFYAETAIHKQYSAENAFNKGDNVVVTGYPGIDILIDENYSPNDPWRHSNKKLKRIIWAPHHTITNDSGILFSSFLSYADYMMALLEKYKDYIQIAFKPHPSLKPRLYEYPDWGKEKTDDYYDKWNSLTNAQLVEGRYEDLFLTSDAMIHDSGSFLIEYLYTNKPVLRTDRDDSIKKRLNSFAHLAYDLHYHAKSEEDIDVFIQNLINDKDELKESREEFILQYLLPPNNQAASQNIVDDIIKALSLDHR